LKVYAETYIRQSSLLPWIEAEFGMSQRTAYRFMDVAKAYSGKVATVASIEPATLYELAAPKSVRRQIQHRVEFGPDPYPRIWILLKNAEGPQSC
jgi:hypothetical protein